jgi:MipA family protein
VIRHREKRFGDDFWQVHGYLKAWFYGFPWDRYVRTRLGFGGGLSYTEHISAMERRDQALHGRGNWKLLNYLDPTIDFSLGDLLRSPSLKETFLGMGVSHRSGMFGKAQLFGDITGGSNYIYGYVEHNF